MDEESIGKFLEEHSEDRVALSNNIGQAALKFCNDTKTRFNSFVLIMRVCLDDGTILDLEATAQLDGESVNPNKLN